MKLTENLEKLSPRYTIVEHKKNKNYTAVRLERPHSFHKEPFEYTDKNGEKQIINLKEYVRFNIQNESQDITYTITEEQKEIILAILKRPKDYSNELLIDRLFEIQRDFTFNSSIKEINFLGGLTSTLLSIGLQEEFINQAIDKNLTMDQIMIVVFHFLIFQIGLKTTKYLSEFIYKQTQNYEYRKFKDSNQ